MWGKKEYCKDRDYSWLVLLFSFLSHMMHIGFTSGVIGILTIAHAELLEIDTQLSSLIGTVNIGVLFISAPLAATLVKILGCGITQLIGGTFMMSSIALSSLTTEVWHAFLLFGVTTAFGTSCCYSACSQILPQYFNRFKYFAFSSVMVGYFLGVVIWPVTSQLLIDAYGYSKAMGYMSIFHVIHLIAAVVFIHPSCPDKSSDDAESEMNIIHMKKQASTSKCEPSVKLEEVDNSSWTDLLDDCKILLSSPMIWMLLLNALFWNSNSAAFKILVSEYSVWKLGISAVEAALGITISGITSVVGCLCVVFSSTLQFNRLILHSASIMVFALSTIILAFSINKTMYYILAALYGLGYGVTVTNMLTVISDFCQIRHLTMLFGLHLLAEGIGSSVTVPLIGYISAASTQLVGLTLCGCAGVIGSLCLIPPILSNYRNRKYEQY